MYILLFGLTIISCQKEIDVNLNDADPKLVIEANYTGEDSTVRVRVTMTSNYFSVDPNPTIDAAVVSITDYNGVSTNLTPLGNGDYILSNYAPTYNTSYTVVVNHNGTSYSASSYMPSPVPLDPITPYFIPGFFGAEAGYVIRWNFQDPPGIGNYYMAIVTYNGEVKDSVYQRYLQDDELLDGNSVSRPIGDFVNKYQTGDTLGLEMQTIDKVIFDYYDELISVASGGGQAAPANPTYQWTNKALGYFSAYGNSRQELVIP